MTPRQARLHERARSHNLAPGELVLFRRGILDGRRWTWTYKADSGWVTTWTGPGFPDMKKAKAHAYKSLKLKAEAPE